MPPCRRHLLRAQWFSPSYSGQLRCGQDTAAILRKLPVYEAAAAVAAAVAAPAQPSQPPQEGSGLHPQTAATGSTNNSVNSDESARAQPATAVKPEARSGTISATAEAVTAAKPPPQPEWMDLQGTRLLAHASIPARALPKEFISADSAVAEQVLTELLGVRHISEAETYRCVCSLSPPPACLAQVVSSPEQSTCRRPLA